MNLSRFILRTNLSWWQGQRQGFIFSRSSLQSPTFEEKFARMEYVGDAKFALSFMRHTGKWVALFTGISVDECLKAIQDDPWFMP
jgi:hypothetical protein